MNSSEAVAELRRRLNESQQAFATRLGLSIRAIANYEGGRAPAGRSLIQLHQLAVGQNHIDLARIFWDGATKELGLGLMGIQGVMEIRNIALDAKKQLLVNADPTFNPDQTGAHHFEPVDCVAVLDSIARKCVEMNPTLQYMGGEHLNPKPGEPAK